MAGWRQKRAYRTDYTPRFSMRIRKKKKEREARAFLKKLDPLREQRRKINTKAVGRWALEIALVLVLAFVAVTYFGIRVISMDNGMNPQIRNQQSVMVNRVVYNASKPKRGDIIVFKPRGNEKDRYYIRRIIGMPGEKLQIKDGAFYIDGKKLNASYAKGSIAEPGLAEETVRLGNDEYFVMSDNQYNMEDSRASNIGNVKRSAVYGKAWFVPSISRQFGFLK